jgi:hypothetical protein
LVIVKESFSINHHTYNHIALAAFDKVVQGDSFGGLGFGHIKDLIFDILHIETSFLFRLKFLNN